MGHSLEISTSIPRSHLECLERQNVCFESGGDVPPDDASRVDIGDERHVREPGPYGDVGDVGNPELS